MASPAATASSRATTNAGCASRETFAWTDLAGVARTSQQQERDFAGACWRSGAERPAHIGQPLEAFTAVGWPDGVP